MTIREAAARHGVCIGQRQIDAGFTLLVVPCPLLGAAHRRGFIDPFGVAHYTDRRFTRRALRNLLLLVARRNRLADPEYLNIPEHDFYYLWDDNVTASRMAMNLGVRLPARLSRLDRLRCLQLARRRGVRLSKRSAIYSWAHS